MGSLWGSAVFCRGCPVGSGIPDVDGDLGAEADAVQLGVVDDDRRGGGGADLVLDREDHAVEHRPFEFEAQVLALQGVACVVGGHVDADGARSVLSAEPADGGEVHGRAADGRPVIGQRTVVAGGVEAAGREPLARVVAWRLAPDQHAFPQRGERSHSLVVPDGQRDCRALIDLHARAGRHRLHDVLPGPGPWSSARQRTAPSTPRLPAPLLPGCEAG